jgi:hypothetical protein
MYSALWASSPEPPRNCCLVGPIYLLQQNEVCFADLLLLFTGNENLKAIDRTVLKQMYGAIATVIVEYAKTDTTAEALR